MVDEYSLSTVLRNLLSNAIKYTNENGKIQIKSKRDNTLLEITVEDNGIGISRENILKLFRIDCNLSIPGTNNETGTGLGLILCKEFVEKNGGEIWCESQPGNGSKFIFTVPAAYC